VPLYTPYTTNVALSYIDDAGDSSLTTLPLKTKLELLNASSIRGYAQLQAIDVAENKVKETKTNILEFKTGAASYAASVSAC